MEKARNKRIHVLWSHLYKILEKTRGKPETSLQWPKAEQLWCEDGEADRGKKAGSQRGPKKFFEGDTYVHSMVVMVSWVCACVKTDQIKLFKYA